MRGSYDPALLLPRNTWNKYPYQAVRGGKALAGRWSNGTPKMTDTPETTEGFYSFGVIGGVGKFGVLRLTRWSNGTPKMTETPETTEGSYSFGVIGGVGKFGVLRLTR